MLVSCWWVPNESLRVFEERKVHLSDFVAIFQLLLLGDK